MIFGLTLQGIENGIRLLVPIGLLGILFLLSITSIPVSQIAVVKPGMVLMAIYYWSIYRPTLMPPVLCFILGLMTDIISGMPLGVNAAIFTLVQWIVRDQRKFLMGQAYVTIWAVFVLVAMISFMAQWVMYGLAGPGWPPAVPVLINIGATALVFPVISAFLVLTHKVLPAAPKVF